MQRRLMTNYLQLFKESTKTTVRRVEREGDKVVLYTDADMLPWELLSVENLVDHLRAADTQGNMEVVLGSEEADLSGDMYYQPLAVEAFAPFVHFETEELMVMPVS